MASLTQLATNLQAALGEQIVSSETAYREITLVVNRENLLTVAAALRDNDDCQFDQLIDVCGVDYADYGQAEWSTENASGTGFDRAAQRDEKITMFENPHAQRFAAVYHLLSTTLNHRVRLRVYLPEDDCRIDSVCEIWPAANWFEREAFDMMGILFINHPDLRRLLTDYGFIGHPFRKDFPLIGHLEMRYDATEQRVVYEPVSIKPRILVPRVIRDDSRYIGDEHSSLSNEQG